MSASTSARSPGRLRGMAEQGPLPFEPDPMARRETLQLVRAYYRITDPRAQAGLRAYQGDGQELLTPIPCLALDRIPAFGRLRRLA